MPSKLRKALGAVKDQTSISLAKVTNAANLEVIILKATTHDKNPIEERYVTEILNIVSSNKLYAAACAQAIGKRIGKTRNWVVALKSLMIVLRIFQDGDPYFPREVFHAMKRGAKILNLSSFKDDSNSSPWDYTAFIRTFALYLDERLDCFLTGKLQRRFTYHSQAFLDKNQRSNKLSNEPGIRDMKPTLVIDRIIYWQKLMDRAIGTRPTGFAKSSRLIQISLFAIVQESFDLYKDISDGLAVVLDNFFNLPLAACVTAYNACVKSYKQFDELSTFYSFCASIGIGRPYDYPSVQKVSEELMETLQAFLKDQASFSLSSNGSKCFTVNSTPKDSAAAAAAGGSSSSQDEGTEKSGSGSGTLERFFGSGSELGSKTSLEDLMSATDAAMSPVGSSEHSSSSDQSDPDDKQSQCDDFASANDGSCSTRSGTVDHTARSSLDIISFDDETNDQVEEQNTKGGANSDSSKDCWELVLAKTVTASTESSPKLLTNGFDPFADLFDFDQPSVQPLVPQQTYNPFLEDMQSILAPPASATTTFVATFNDVFDLSPTFKATAASPTFNATQDQSSNSITDLELIFGDMLRNDTKVAPTFGTQCSAESNMMVSPTFHSQKTSDNMIIVAPTFEVHSSNVNQNAANWSIVPLDFFNSEVAPTFSAKSCNETTLVRSIEDDPFGTWSNATTNDQMSNVSMHEQTLLRQQQQLWLEQQSKIIAKYMMS